MLYRTCLRRAAAAVCLLALCRDSHADQAGVTAVGTTAYPHGGMAEVGSTSAFSREDQATCAAVSPDGLTAWIGTSALDFSPAAGIARIDLASMQKTGSIQLESGEHRVAGAAADPAGQYAYFAISGSTNRLLRVDAASSARAGNADLIAEDGNPSCLVVESTGAHAYVAAYNHGDQMSRIVKINLATFAREAALVMPVGDQIFASGCVDPANAHAYFLNFGTDAPRLVKVRLADFARLDNLQLNLYSQSSMSMDPAGAYLYVAGAPTFQDGSGFVRVHLDDFFTTDEFDLSGTDLRLGSLTPSQNGAEGLALFSNGQGMRLDLTNFSQISPGSPANHISRTAIAVPMPGAPDRILAVHQTTPPLAEVLEFAGNRSSPVVLEGGEFGFVAMIRDADGKHCFLAADNTSSHSANFHPLVKVGMDDLNRIGQVIVSLQGHSLRSADSDGRYAYVGTLAGSDGGNRLFKADLDAMSMIGSAPIQTGVNAIIESVAYNPTFDRVYLYTRQVGVEGILGYMTGDLSAFTPIANYADSQHVPSMTANPNNGDLYFALLPNNVVGRYPSATGLIGYSPAAFNVPRIIMRNPLTGHIYAGTHGPAAKIYDLEPINLEVQQSLDTSMVPGHSGNSLVNAAIDPLGRYAAYSDSGALMKHNLANFQHADILPGQPFAEAVLTDADGGRVFSYNSFENRLRKIRLTPRDRAEGTRFQLTGEAEVNSVHFYSHAAVGPRRSDVAPTGYDAVSFRSGFIDRVRGRAWFGTNQAPGRVIEFDAATRTVVGTLPLAAGEDYLSCGAIDPSGEFGYFGTDTAPGKVVKVRLADSTRIDALPLNSGEDNLRAAAIDPAGEFAYFATSSLPGSIVKVQLSDFSRVDALPLNSEEANITGFAIDPAGNNLYAAGTVGFFVAGIVKVQLSDFTRVAMLGSSAQFPAGIAIDPAGTYLYAAGSSLLGSGIIDRVRLSDFMLEAPPVNLGPDDEFPGPIAVDPAGQFLLVGCYDVPANIVKIRLDGFTRESAGSLRPNLETGITTLLLDAAGEFAFIGLETTPGRIVSFEISPKPLRLGLFQYFGQFMLRKWQSQPMAVTQPESWISVPIADGSPSQLTLEPGEYVLAWQFDADESGPSFAPGPAGAGIQAPLAFGDFPDAFSQNPGSSTKWIDTASQWSAYVEFDAQAGARGWELLD